MIWTIISFLISAVVVVIDQLTKVAAVNKLAPHGSFEVIPKVLYFTYVENDGMALGLLDNARWVFMTVSTVAIIAFVVYMIFWRPKSKFACVALSLIIGGGIGNMIDRCFYTGIVGDTAGEKVVRDFIDFRGFGELWPWVFNFADACVCVGGAMLFIWCVASMIKESKLEKAAKAAKAMADNTDKTEKKAPENGKNIADGEDFEGAAADEGADNSNEEQQ